MNSSVKALVLGVAILPLLAACGTYTNKESSGYGYDRDNVKGHNEYRPDQESYMNYQQLDTHCGHADCKNIHMESAMGSDEPGMVGKGKHGKMHEGMMAPDGSPLMKAKSSMSIVDAEAMAHKKCAAYDGIRIWKKGMWKDKYVVKYTCFNK